MVNAAEISLVQNFVEVLVNPLEEILVLVFVSSPREDHTHVD